MRAFVMDMAYLERVTIRLPKQQIEQIDMLVKVGEFSSRSDVLRTAVKELLYAKIEKVMEHAEKLKKFQELASTMRMMEKYSKK